ncbi:MAG: hypothetical protein ACJ77A_16755 [Actinomycetota bacterium]
MPVGELVFANVVDQRVFQVQGREGEPGIYVLTLPGRALPFSVYRAWKAPTGLVAEEIRFTAPSGAVAHRWGPTPRRMVGSMDLTIEQDVVDDAVLGEAGTYVASFILEDQIIGEIEVPVYLQQSPTSLPKHIEDGLKRSDVIWVGVPKDGQRKKGLFGRHKGTINYPNMIPAWFAYKGGKIYVLSQKEHGPQEQTIPGLGEAPEVTVITRRKGRDTSLDRFHASVRMLEEGPDYDQALGVLADRRRSRVGPPEESIERWRGSAVVAELTPIVSL